MRFARHIIPASKVRDDKKGKADMTKNFASTGDLEEKKVTFKEIGPPAFCLYRPRATPTAGIMMGG